MDEAYLNQLSKLEYAQLEKIQEEKLRTLEKEFNNEFGTDFYFMVMKNEA